MVQVKNFKMYFKHSILNQLENKGWGVMEVEGNQQSFFSLTDEEFLEFNYLTKNGLNGRTWCYVEKDGVVVYEGTSECKKEDNFCKEKGCYASLDNATKFAPISVKEDLFKSFKNRKPKLDGKVLVNGQYYDEEFLDKAIRSYFQTKLNESD